MKTMNVRTWLAHRLVGVVQWLDPTMPARICIAAEAIERETGRKPRWWVQPPSQAAAPGEGWPPYRSRS